LDAVHGGGRVIADFLTQITARHSVAIVCFREADEPGVDLFFRQRCESVEEIVRPSSRKSASARLIRYFRLVLSLVRLQPLWITDWSSWSFARKARAVAKRVHPVVIQAETHVMGQYLPALKGIDARLVLVEYEPGVRAAPYIQNLPRVFKSVVNRVEGISWRRYAASLYRRVDAIVVLTEADRRSIMEAAGQTPVYIIPPGTVIPEYPLSPLGIAPMSLLFIGNFIHPPNLDAARRLIQAIFPSVQSQVPGIKLVLVGAHPPAEIRAMSGQDIVITGQVADVMPYLDRAALCVAPMYLGGGMRIKVLEALAAGKAVVTTPLGVEGLDGIDGAQVSLAENDVEFIERIVYLLEHPDARASLARQARKWASEHINWVHSMARYETLYAELLEQPDQFALRRETEKQHP
jgi:glycosyltransferase involved in cell wall biosynthesis